ncbi:MAG: hypothetical protein J6S50_07575 [Oscillospiraceae bacterium]|nr:hypothetical protein [Oscillospiraceae bacterium]
MTVLARHVRAVSFHDYEADVNSMLGIFGLDISKPLRVSICGSAAGEQNVCEALKQYYT